MSADTEAACVAAYTAADGTSQVVDRVVHLDADAVGGVERVLDAGRRIGAGRVAHDPDVERLGAAEGDADDGDDDDGQHDEEEERDAIAGELTQHHGGEVPDRCPGGVGARRGHGVITRPTRTSSPASTTPSTPS